MTSSNSLAHNIDLNGIAISTSWEELKDRRIEYQTDLQQLKCVLPIAEWMSLVNHMHDLFVAKVLKNCEDEMVVDGYGLPPVVYSFVVFGSAGRLESTLWSDQDNGMIISDDFSESKNKYFEKFSMIVCDRLAYLGYEKCLGKVMCSEPMWRRSLQEWKSTLADWGKDMSWEPTRYLIIAADVRHIAGDYILTEQFKKALYQIFETSPELRFSILRNTVKHKATLNLLGRVVTERFGEHAGEFDVKYGLYIPLVNFVRFMAIQFSVQETMTQSRLDKLMSLGAEDIAIENCHKAFEIAIQLRASTSYTIVDGLFIGSNYIPEQDLKRKPIMHDLRESLGTVRRTHRVLQRMLRYADWKKL